MKLCWWIFRVIRPFLRSSPLQLFVQSRNLIPVFLFLCSCFCVLVPVFLFLCSCFCVLVLCSCSGLCSCVIRPFLRSSSLQLFVQSRNLIPVFLFLRSCSCVLVFVFLCSCSQGSLSRVYGLLITRVSLKINGGMWLILYDQQSIYSWVICFFLVPVFLFLCSCFCVLVPVFLFLCSCFCVLVLCSCSGLCSCFCFLVFLFLCSCFCVLVFLFLCSCSCVLVFLFLCSCSCVLVPVFLFRMSSCFCVLVYVFKTKSDYTY